MPTTEQQPIEIPTAEKEKIQRHLTPTRSRILIASLDAKFFNKDESLPQAEEAERGKAWLSNRTPDHIKYGPLEALSQKSRERYWKDKPGNIEEWNTSWKAKTTDWIKRNVEGNDGFKDEIAETLSFVGIEINKDNIEENLSEKVVNYRKNYLDGKSDINKFVSDIAAHCKTNEGTVDLDQLERRLTSIKGFITTFGKEYEIPELVQDYATIDGMLSQKKETKQFIANEAWEKARNPLPDREQARIYRLYEIQKGKLSKEPVEPASSGADLPQQRTESRSEQTATTRPITENQPKPETRQEGARPMQPDASPKRSGETTLEEKLGRKLTPLDQKILDGGANEEDFVRVAKRYDELENKDNHDVLPKDTIKTIKEALAQLRNQKNEGTLTNEQYEEQAIPLRQRMDKTRFTTDNLEDIKIFCKLLYKDDSENIDNFAAKQFDLPTEADRKAGKKIMYAFEFSKDQNGNILYIPRIIERQSGVSPDVPKPERIAPQRPELPQPQPEVSDNVKQEIKQQLDQLQEASNNGEKKLSQEEMEHVMGWEHHEADRTEDEPVGPKFSNGEKITYMDEEATFKERQGDKAVINIRGTDVTIPWERFLTRIPKPAVPDAVKEQLQQFHQASEGGKKQVTEEQVYNITGWKKDEDEQ